MSYGIGIVALGITCWIAGSEIDRIGKQLGEVAAIPRGQMAAITVMSVCTVILGMTLIGYACIADA